MEITRQFNIQTPFIRMQKGLFFGKKSVINLKSELKGNCQKPIQKERDILKENYQTANGSEICLS